MAWFAFILRLLLLVEIENNMLKYGLNPTPGEGELGFYKVPLRDCLQSTQRLVFYLNQVVLYTIISITGCFDPSSPTS